MFGWKENILFKQHIPMKWFCIMRLADFGLFWPKCASVFLNKLFFLWAHQLATFRDQSTILGEHLDPKLPPAPTYNPFFGQRHSPGVIFFGLLSKGRFNLWAKYSKPKKQITTFFFLFGATRAWSSNLCAAEFTHYDSDPIILNGFHKFVMSMGPNTCDRRPALWGGGNPAPPRNNDQNRWEVAGENKGLMLIFSNRGNQW